MNICDKRDVPSIKWVQMVILKGQMGRFLGAPVLSLVHLALKEVPNVQLLGIDRIRMLMAFKLVMA